MAGNSSHVGISNLSLSVLVHALRLHATVLLRGMLLLATAIVLTACDKLPEDEPVDPIGPTFRGHDPTTSGYITAHLGSNYGGRNTLRPKHNGVDIGHQPDQSIWVYAPEAGTIVDLGPKADCRGNMIEIDHGGGIHTLYYHLASFAPGLAKGSQVAQGEHIGDTDTTGINDQGANCSTAAHLHFKVLDNGATVNPLLYIQNFYADHTGPCGEQNCGSGAPGAQPETEIEEDVPPATSGGLESAPLWLWHEHSARSDNRSDSLQPPPLWKWANSSPYAHEAVSPSANLPSAAASVPLADLLPPGDLLGATRVLGVPEDVLGNSNALEAISADYIVDSADGEVITATVALFRTAGEVYAHDLAVCSRFKSGLLQATGPITATDAPVATGPVYFWARHLRKIRSASAFTTGFAVFANADWTRFQVDSRWISDAYPSYTGGDILTYQIAGHTQVALEALTRAIGDDFLALGEVEYLNNSLPPTPLVAVARADYALGRARLETTNYTTATQVITYTAVMWSAPYSASEATRHFTVTVPPGQSTVELAAPGVLSAVIYAHDPAGFVDKVYVSDGSWFAFDDSASGGDSQAAFSAKTCSSLSTTGENLLVAGCGQLTGNVAQETGYIGLGRTLFGNVRSPVPSNYRALHFRARGDGKPYLAKLEIWAPGGGSYQYGYAFTPGEPWQEYTVDFADFTPLWGAPQLSDWAGKTLAWVTSGGPWDSVWLEVDAVELMAWPRPTAPTVTVATAGNDVSLSWLPVSTTTQGDPITIASYQVWRAVLPYRVVGESGVAQVADVAVNSVPEPEPSWTDIDALGEAGSAYYYQVVAVPAVGSSSKGSPEQAVFSFPLARGSSSVR